MKSFILNATFFPDTDYEVQGRIVPFSARATETTDWLEVRTPDIRLGSDDILPIEYAQLGADVVAAIDQIHEGIAAAGDAIDTTQADLAAEVARRSEQTARAATNLRDLKDRLDQVALGLGDIAASQYSDTQRVRRELRSEADGARAFATSEVLVATGPGSAIAQRLDTLDAQDGSLAASIAAAQQARIDGDQALANAVTLLSVGNDQFDHLHIWRFDATVEGWTGNGAPTAIDGYLIPADHATDPHVLSPAGLGIDPSSYRQVRGRLQRTGAPTWAGQIRWATVANPTFDDTRMVTISEPSFDGNGVAQFTFNVNWSGDAIDRIKLDLTTVQEPANSIRFEWIGVGSPSPGASRADVSALQQAMVDADSALASDIALIEGALNDPATGLDATFGAVQLVEGRVDTVEGGLAVVVNDLDAAELEIAGKASQSSVDGMQSQIDAKIEGDDPRLLLLSDRIASIRQQLEPMALAFADRAATSFAEIATVRGVVTEMRQTLTSQIEVNSAGINANLAALTAMQAVIPDLATGSGLNALTVRVEATETSLLSQSTALTTVQNALTITNDNVTAAQTAADNAYALAGGKGKVIVQSAAPDAGDRLAQNLWIDTTGNANTPKRWNGSEWVSVTDKVATDAAAAAASALSGLSSKADASALSTLASTVSSQGGLITSQGSAITTLQGAVNDGTSGLAATYSAVTSLTGTVTSQGATLTSHAGLLSGIQATLGDVSASANIKFDVQAGTDGYAADIALVARTGGSGPYRDAALLIQVPSSPSDKTRVVVAAEEFAITDGANKATPFVYAGGVAYMEGARIGTVYFNQLSSTNGKLLLNGSGGNASIEIFT